MLQDLSFQRGTSAEAGKSHNFYTMRIALLKYRPWDCLARNNMYTTYDCRRQYSVFNVSVQAVEERLLIFKWWAFYTIVSSARRFLYY